MRVEPEVRAIYMGVGGWGCQYDGGVCLFLFVTSRSLIGCKVGTVKCAPVVKYFVSERCFLWSNLEVVGGGRLWLLGRMYKLMGSHNRFAGPIVVARVKHDNSEDPPPNLPPVPPPHPHSLPSPQQNERPQHEHLMLYNYETYHVIMQPPPPPMAGSKTEQNPSKVF